jgi:hypothetical protein
MAELTGSRCHRSPAGRAAHPGARKGTAKPWTNHPLVAARQVSSSRGFQLVESPHRSDGVDLVGEVYELALTDGGAGG